MFQVTNYHSKKALISALLAGKKVKIVPIPLTKAQQKENSQLEAEGKLPKHSTLSPSPGNSHEILCTSNKQVPVWEATVVLDSLGFIERILQPAPTSK